MTTRDLVAAAVLVACARVPLAAAQREPLTVERITMGPPLGGTPPSAPAWSSDSRVVAFLWSDSGGLRDLWTVERAGGAARRLTCFADSSRVVSALAWLPGDRALVVLAGYDVYRIGAAGGVARLTTDGRGKGELAVSPDGSRVTWLADGDLPYGTYHRPDMEVGPGTWGGSQPSYAWSPDGRRIALHVVDRRMVHALPMPFYLGGEPSMQRVRRGAPGDVNEARTVRLLDLATRHVDSLPLPEPQRFHLVAFAYGGNGALLLDRESDDATVRQIQVLDAGASEPHRVWEDARRSRARASSPQAPVIRRNGTPGA